MADVVQKCISGNATHEGSAVVAVTANGTKQVLRKDKEKTISVQRIEDKLTTRLDDPTYYTA